MLSSDSPHPLHLLLSEHRPSFRFDNRYQIKRVDVQLILGAFFDAQLPTACLSGKRVDASLSLRELPTI